MQSILTAQGNIYNVLFNDYFGRKQISEERVKKVRDSFGIDLTKYPLVGNKNLETVVRILMNATINLTTSGI